MQSTSPAPGVGELRERLASLTLLDERRLGRRLRRAAGTRDPQRRARALSALAAEIERAERRIERRRASVPAVSYPDELPITARRDDLLQAIRDNQVVVVAGETGSGKTTQLPKLCLELGRGVRGAIAHTQPRRLAARTVAERIADELGVQLGGAVGYAVRFNDRTNPDTLVRLCTDGLLLAEIAKDRDLLRYDTIIVDEAHERSLNIHFLLGYLARLLPRRPDLKVIITSATIDPERLAEHFGGAPVIEVSGRTYPVEVRYRPLPEDADPEADQPEAIAEAVEELLSEQRHDVLVFLSGEREIRDTADVLRGRLGERVEVLPLYARLATAEQQRVFRPSGRPRVVLATNVAETSLTVPGIRSVVDTGVARISRYSARLKVQRLPIEAISQASAEQRKGRCGRVAPGVCIRLYDEEDFEQRPRFTDPEILRTNLAAVLLQMAALGLGDIEDFPFIDPPDRRQVRDGINLLRELGALQEGGKGGLRLTDIGRRLARLPVDPRLGRMVLEADRLRCASEVIVIAAALSIQDVRERPEEQRAHADQLHARFKDPDSDFIGLLNLWRYLREQQRALSSSRFRRKCKQEHLHYLRVREWQDLVAQLRQAAEEAGVRLNDHQPAEPDRIHQALLAGLLSHIGMRDRGRREYVGARGARFQIFPGSALNRAQPAWIMAAELVETTRLWGRVVARIRPEWIEPLAEHLVKRSYGEPRWDRKRGAVVATERVTLYGLPIVSGRTVAYSRIDPQAARELFIRRALVERDWDCRHEFFVENGRRIEEIEKLEARERRRDILVDDRTLFEFFDARIPEEVVSGRHFDRWWRDARRESPDLLTYPRELLVRPEAADALDGRGRPAVWKQGDLRLRLSYAFEPGSDRDGVTVHIPLELLGRVRAARFEWLVPALREELVAALLRGLPKEIRRSLVPLPDLAAQIVPRLRPRRLPLAQDMAAQIAELRGVTVDPGLLDFERLPPHLRMTFSVEDAQGRVLAQGFDLDELRKELRPTLRARLTEAARAVERDGMRTWEIDALPRTVTLPEAGVEVRGYPALVDQGDSVAVRVLESPEAQAAAMANGTRCLLLLDLPSPAKQVLGGLDSAAQLTLATAPHGSVEAVVNDAAACAVDALVAEAGGPAWDAEAYRRLRAHVAGALAARTARVLRAIVAILDVRREIDRLIGERHAAPFEAARLDIARQVGGLVHPGFATAVGEARLPDIERYLRGCVRRLERLPDNLAADRDRMAAIHELEAEYERRRDGLDVRRREEIRFLLQELRLAQLAPGIPTSGHVSAKRIRRMLADGPSRSAAGAV